MKKLTFTDREGNYIVENTVDAISRLAKFEDFYFSILSKQAEITLELEKLRSEDKMKTVKFRQLLALKLTNSNILIMLKAYGLE